ncbi:T9SS type A sorting domain-containing protein [Flavobacterium sp. Sd200]|uniref:T9SS type A sorting domain-containing protein n=1 Tax=Flavobacterium sp. Sd200 TaxID=2692211 RepID=UPI001367CA57|nr:T9SS type A sorting domain-containing protein [Flavobacterium sp. Sd200]MXN89739.1 T9SS type A sorting domain-containing protein [Flavobacterium sp. Sd200]
MKKKLLTALLLAGSLAAFAQETCSYGTTTDITGMGENISTGGQYEYAGAVDFNVPFATSFSANSITINVLKGNAPLNYVNVSFLNEEEGMPGSVIQAFDNLVPTAEEFVYDISEGELDTYQITLALPSEVVLETGKYFIKVAANTTDENGVWWEITSEEQTYGVFDYSTFESDPWGGGGYYNKVFQVGGTCTPTGEEQPNYGEVCGQQNASNNYEGGVHFVQFGQVVTIADDIIVPENTTFYLTDFTMSALMTGTIHNATIKIRSSNFFLPGEVLHSFTNKGPDYEEFDGWRPFPGSRSDVATVKTNFKFDEPIALTAGTYFIEVTPTLYFSDLTVWETTTLAGIGVDSYTSYDSGTTWQQNTDLNQVFTVGGFCSETMDTETPKATQIKYYPNPVKDVLTIASQSRVEAVKLYAIDGRSVSGYTVNENSVDMRLLANGMYMVNVMLENGGSQTFKVIKQ